MEDVSRYKSLPVIFRIRFESDVIERNTGKAPISVYLGYSEVSELRSWMKGKTYEDCEVGLDRVDGKRLYVVTEHSHLRVV